MMKKTLIATLILSSLVSANVYATNPASTDYVKAYVQSTLANLPAGPAGATGATGPAGIPGPTGPAGVSNYADFFALMPSDNTLTIGVGTDVLFPQDGATSGVITRISPSSFQLTNTGTYLITFQVSVTEAGQLDLTLNGVEQAQSVVGRATGTSQIMGTTLITTSSPNAVLTVRNPSVNSTALTITPTAGGAKPVSAHLTILQLA